MKRLHSILLSALAAVLAIACEPKETEKETVPMSASPESVSMAALGENKTITLTSSTDWYARSSEKWLKILTASGKGSDAPQQLPIMAEENKKTEERSATVTISNLDGEQLSISVNQAAGSGESTRRGIYTAEDLLGFARAVNGEGSISLYLVDGSVRLMADIDASSIKEWIPAGSKERPLTYSFDGAGHSILNVNWRIDVSKYPYAGFIGYAKGISVERLTFGSPGSRVELKGSNSSLTQAGGIAGAAFSSSFERVTNNATLVMLENSCPGKNLSIGGIVGYSDSGSNVGLDSGNRGCINNGDLLVNVPGKEGGLVGHNEGIVTSSTNYGAILGKISGNLGPGWGCSYNAAKDKFFGNFGYGHVGDYDRYASNPSAAPADALLNSMMNASEGYDIEKNTIDWTADSYYDWQTLESYPLAEGVTYSHYSWTGVPRHMHMLEVDLSNPRIELASAVADDVFPNPNGNNNGNNGFNKRETLSQLCTRKRSEGQDVIAGVNCCFFDSHNGISRGYHVQDCEPMYINNPKVVENFPNHGWCFAVYTDGTAACGKKYFKGTLRTGGSEYPFYTVNDTTLRHASTISPVNLFTSSYVRTPHPEYPKLVNDLALNVLYIICEYSSEPMKVNTGFASAKVVQVLDGRMGAISELPYISSSKRVGIALSGSYASALADVKVGDTIEFKCEITVEGHATTPIFSLESTMFQIMDKGSDNTSSIPSSHSNITTYDPMTFPVVSEDGRKVWLVEIDGRQDWYSMGVKAYEVYRIAKKLGGWSVSRMDGGGSSAMWVRNPSTGWSGLVNSPCDPKGERSCLTYMILRQKH